MTYRDFDFRDDPGPRDASASAPRNRLAEESSPYLLQHADNPIGWYPWGDEAFEAARREDKPVFLSIGYSSCHWCHVMEQECFSDPEVADLMNDTCIAVKVDREERPDLDGLFMEICHIQNGNGGWPLNLFLTSEGRPFFAATWLPKRTTGQMPGMTDILPRVKWLWAMQREDVLRGADSLVEALSARLKTPAGGRVGVTVARSALNELQGLFDSQWGGFGFSPKFPAVPRLLFLLDQARSAVNSQAEREEIFAMADLTLRRMWRGGIHDHLGGGFARYATDEQWLLPHFEKMLADQALLLLTAALAQEVRPDPFYRTLAEDIVGCVQRNFTAPAPGSCFWTSLDADSEGGEGRYYLWTEEEVRRCLPEGDFGLFCTAYAILPGGNFGHELTGRQTGRNILYEASTVMELSRRYGLRPPDTAARLARGRDALLEARSRRRPPALDDKVLMDWNGLTIGALARASAIFEQPDWRLLAEQAALFLQKVLPDPKGNWRRCYRNGKANIPALPGDYAALLWGVMELHRAAASAGARKKQLRDWLRYAETLADKLLEEFWDPEAGGLYLSPAGDLNIFLRHKAACDDALPSANALAAAALAELGSALGERRYMDQAREIVACFARAAARRPLEHLSLITAAGALRSVRAVENDAETEEGKALLPEAPEGLAPEDFTAPDPAPHEEVPPRRHVSERSRRDRASARSERRFSRNRRSGLKDR